MPKLRGVQAAGSAKNSRLAARKPPKLQPGAKALAASAASKASLAEARNKPPIDYQQRALPYHLQQGLLDVFGRALAPALASPRLNEALQAVKQALFERDFAGAFGSVGDAEAGVIEPADKAKDKEEEEGDTAEQKHLSVQDAIPPLNAYAARWSPTRALCYAAVLGSPLVQEHWNAAQPESKPPLRMVAIGGGAAEIVAFGALLTNGEVGDNRGGDLVLIDSGPWASVIGRLRSSMTEAGPDNHTPALVEPAERFGVDVRQRDILKVEDEEMHEIIAGAGGAGGAAGSPRATTLVTLFFTLNELFTTGGLGAAATFLLRLTAAALPGTVLLIVDSPGSYAEMAVGTQARRYPMRWLLDKFLLRDSEAWTKVHEDEAVWFRLSASLSYPISLEDMRYQVHLYVRR